MKEETARRLVSHRSVFRAEALDAQSTGELGEPGLRLTNGLFLTATATIALLGMLAAAAVSRPVVVADHPDCPAADVRQRSRPSECRAGKSYELQPVSSTLSRLGQGGR